MRTTDSIAPLSAAASSARRLSQRVTEELVRRVLARVAETPTKLRDVLDAYQEPLIAFGADRYILTANSSAERFFGYERGALDGHITDTIVPVRLRQPDAPPMQAFDTITTVELPGLRRDGTEPNLSWTFGTVFHESRPIFVMVVRDRAEIDDALEALHANEQRLRLLVEGVRDHAILMLDANGLVASWNAGAERIMGWTAGEIVGQSHEAFHPPEERQAGIAARNLEEARRDGYKNVVGWRMRRDGTRFYAEVSIWPLYTDDGKLQGFAKVTHDLTERLEAEETRRRAESERAAREAAEAGLDRLARLHRAAQALAAAATPVEVADAILTSCLTEVGAPAGVLMRISADGKALTLVAGRGHPDELLQDYRSIPLDGPGPATDAVRALAPLFFESADACVARYPRYDAAIRKGGFEASAALPLIAHGMALGVLSVRYRERHEFTDAERSLLLTVAEMSAQALERARLFEQHAEARVAAEAASRAKDDFLAMLGHELRNPLAPIATAVDLMKLRGETHSQRERQVIERQLAHISRLVDDLLDVARITRGKLELALEPVDVADAIARAVEIVSPLLEQRRHQLLINATRGIRVNADPSRLTQVVSNLLTNAAKYTAPGGRVEISCGAKGDEVFISVRDNGEGIESDLLPRVFDQFVQGERTFDRGQGGLGIGLALVKNLVTLHGGTVAASSVVGRGSEFTVRLPRLTARAESSNDAASDVVRDATPAKTRKRVLVVDDNEDFADMLATSLTTVGYEVTMALDGASAMQRVREFRPEAAVLDLGLPVLNGFELAQKIREEFADAAPRLIAVTGYGQLHDRQRAQEVGFVEHLVKPVDMNAMLAAIEGAPLSGTH